MHARFKQAPVGTCYLSVDGTDCRIFEPTPFNRRWYSHKFHGPGLRYEVGLALRTGEIAWVHGPFACGEWPDLKIFKSSLDNQLIEGEKVIADGGYQDPACVQTIAGAADAVKFLRAQHEAVNGRLKRFSVLSSRFRHNKDLHCSCFFAVANIVQLELTMGYSTF